jgi:hypothetical protein
MVQEATHCQFMVESPRPFLPSYTCGNSCVVFSHFFCNLDLFRFTSFIAFLFKPRYLYKQRQHLQQQLKQQLQQQLQQQPTVHCIE